MKKIASGITLVLLISMLLLSGSSHSTESTSLAGVEKAINFLVHIQFNQSLGLCRESHLAPNVYWLVSDNLWAWKALKMANMHACMRASLKEPNCITNIRNALTTLERRLTKIGS